MGIGDQIMATGMAKGAKARGRRIAFGDGRQIIWDKHSPVIFQGNPNIAPPGSEGQADIEWVRYYKGNRIYNRQEGDKWIWNPFFRATPGEIFFTDQELNAAVKYNDDFVIVEPHVEMWKSSAANKDWGRQKYQLLVDRLVKNGVSVRQFVFPNHSGLLRGARGIRTNTFRESLAVLKNASAYIGPEGGTHHGAAAVGVKAVVIFGGFIPPSVTGYKMHTNITGGAEACGSLKPCAHCRAAMNKISVDEVYEAAMRIL